MTSSRLNAAVRASWAAVVQNWRPFVLIQGLAIALVVAYYLVPSFQGLADAASRYKVEGGLVFSGLSTAFAGLAIPEIAKRLTLKVKTPANHMAFQVVFFAIIGIAIDLFYRLLAATVGPGHDARTVIEKVLIDQLVFSPLLSIPYSTGAFLWEEHEFSLARTGAAIRGGEFGRRYASVMVSCWAFWFPVLAAVYAMPPNLQFLLFLFAQGAWSLLLVHLAGE